MQESRPTMTIAENINKIREIIKNTAELYQRNPDDIRLIAISKKQSASAIREAWEAGIKEFGENYWQEAQTKLSLLKDLPLIWHFTGPIQSNKAKDIARHFSWAHSIDREKIAILLSQERPSHLSPLNICIQVNLNQETSKAGVCETAATELASRIHQLPGLHLRGFMTIPEEQNTAEKQYQNLSRMHALLKKTSAELQYPLDTLSMGMSNDLPAAIRAGSTMVRIGRAIFGERM